MKYILGLIVFISLNAQADCVNNIPLSEAQKAVALQPNAGAKACDKTEPCLCFDGVDFEVVDIVNNQFVINPTKQAAKAARVQAEAQAKAAEALALQQAAARMADVTQKPTLTLPEATQAIKDLYKLCGK